MSNPKNIPNMANWPFTKNEDAFNKTVLFFTTKITQNLEIRFFSGRQQISSERLRKEIKGTI